MKLWLKEAVIVPISSLVLTLFKTTADYASRVSSFVVILTLITGIFLANFLTGLLDNSGVLLLHGVGCLS